jgi:hypothetical protein
MPPGFATLSESIRTHSDALPLAGVILIVHDELSDMHGKRAAAIAELASVALLGTMLAGTAQASHPDRDGLFAFVQDPSADANQDHRAAARSRLGLGDKRRVAGRLRVLHPVRGRGTELRPAHYYCLNALAWPHQDQYRTAIPAPRTRP